MIYDFPMPTNESKSLEFLAQRLERVMGIEPTSSAWEAEVLPLNHTRFVQNRLNIIRYQP